MTQFVNKYNSHPSGSFMGGTRGAVTGCIGSATPQEAVRGLGVKQVGGYGYGLSQVDTTQVNPVPIYKMESGGAVKNLQNDGGGVQLPCNTALPVKSSQKGGNYYTTVLDPKINMELKGSYPEIKGGMSENHCRSGPAAGGGRGKKHGTRKRRSSKKGSRSKTRPGHKNYMSWRRSKRINSKRLKRLTGKRTGKSRFFFYTGGVGKKGYSHPKKHQKSRRRKGRQDFVTHRGDKYYNRRSHRQTGKHSPYMKRRKSSKKSRSRNRKLRGGANNQGTIGCPQYMSNKPFSSVYSTGGTLAPKNLALANPVPFKAFDDCVLP